MKNNIYMQVFLEMQDDAWKSVKASLDVIATIVQIMIPVLITLVENTVTEKILLSIGYLIVIAYAKALSRKLNHKDDTGFPLPSCKMTRSKGDVVELIEGKGEEAILYLARVEEYLRKHQKVIDN